MNRPDEYTGLCPEGTEPCSPMTTSPENIICYAPDDFEDCPITEIKFINQSEVDSLDETVYTKVFFMDD